MAVICWDVCLGCGDMLKVKEHLLLDSYSSKHVLQIWRSFFEKMTPLDKCSRDFYQNLLVTLQIHRSKKIKLRTTSSCSYSNWLYPRGESANRDCYSLSILFELHYKQISMFVHVFIWAEVLSCCGLSGCIDNLIDSQYFCNV